MRGSWLVWCAGMAALAAGTVVLAQDRDERQMGGVGLSAFSDAKFRGRNATFRDDVADLRPYGLDDTISSLQVAPGEIWEVCELANYRGRCQVVSGTERNLADNGWNDLISSVRRVRGGRGGTFPPGPPSSSGLELYSRPGYEGQRRVLSNAVPDFRTIGFNDAAESLRVSRGGSWQICEDIDYQRCIIVSSDSRDLADIRMLRTVSAARPWGSGRGGPPPVRSRLTLFDDTRYRGRTYNVERAMPTLDGFFNRAESAQVTGGRWELCELPEFKGRCVTLSSDQSSLGSLSNRVNSARPR